MSYRDAPRSLFALALYATRPAWGAPEDHEHEVYLRVALALAADEAEAREKVEARLRELCPPEHGWLNHHVASGRVPKEALPEILAALGEGEAPGGVWGGGDAPEMLM